FGTDAIPFSSSYAGLPGITRSYDTFSAAGHEAGMSRIWAGIHWSFDVTAGDALGQSVATYIFQNFLLPQGNSPRAPGHSSIFFVGSGLAAGERLSATESVGQTGLVSGPASLPLNVGVQLGTTS